jgi:23S rRNA (pseudouridine1915-N3)-methyltransferase
MLKLKILSVGRWKEAWLQQAVSIYTDRLRSQLEIDWKWADNDPQLLQWVEKEPLVVALDPKGKSYTSQEFSSFLFKQFELGGSRLTFVIGGATGLPPSIKRSCSLISLSPLTFTHQITQLILIEQVYRAFEIRKGSHYDK